MLLFTDLETTGLIAAKEAILEVAAILTDDQLNEVARFQRVVAYKQASMIVDSLNGGMPVLQIAQAFQLAPRVVEMHRDNGLWAECATPGAMMLSTVDRDLAKFIKEGCLSLYTDGLVGMENKEGPQLAGNTISFDRAFMGVHLPLAARHLHYRNVDCSTMNELARRFWPEVYAQRPQAPKDKPLRHRAMEDCENSLWLAKYYSTRLVPAEHLEVAHATIKDLYATTNA